jgi:hypothetical protein
VEIVHAAQVEEAEENVKKHWRFVELVEWEKCGKGVDPTHPATAIRN